MAANGVPPDCDDDMLYLISYDISKNKPRTRVAKILTGKGQRVQYSVFECLLSTEELPQLVTLLDTELCTDDHDSVRIYPLPENVVQNIKILGDGEVYQPDQLRIF